MLVAQAFVTHFARAVDLFRDPEAKDEQKAAFRTVLALLKADGAVLKVAGDRLLVNDVPADGPTVPPLVQRMVRHQVTEVTLPNDPPPAHLFELLKALAGEPGGQDIPTRLRATGAERVTVAMARLFPDEPAEPAAPPAPPPSTPAPALEIVKQEEPVAPSPREPEEEGFVTHGASPYGTEGLLRGDSMLDTKSPAKPLEGVGPITHDVPPPPPPVPPPPPPPPQSPPPPSPPRAGVSPEPGAVRAPAPAAAPVPLTGALAELDRNPRAANAGDILAEIGRQVEAATKAGRIEQALSLAAAVARIEQKAGGPNERRQYGIALKRMVSKPLLNAVAQLLSSPMHQADAVTVLQRAGPDGMEVLLELLVAASTVGERRHVFTALSQMKEGTDQLIHMLDHPQWFVGRNVAELIGEIGMEEAVPALAKQIDHQDERVRKAAALSLAKMGTAATAEPLRRALRDKSQEVRIQVALGIGGRKSSALAMPLVVAMEEEKDEAVERELILALGRIASPDAVQALIKFAQPSGRLFGRKPTPLRVAAVEALRIAGTPAAVGTLQGLAGDSDRQVKSAAQAAVAELRKKGDPA